MTSTSGGDGRPGAGGGQQAAAGTRRLQADPPQDRPPQDGLSQDRPSQGGTPWGVLAALGAAGALLGYLAKAPCRLGGAWLDGGQYAAACYSDVFPLYYRDGLDQGALPYLDRPLEYPVLTGGLMHLAGRAVSWLPDTLTRALAYFDLTAALMGACLVATVLCTGHLAGRGGLRPAEGAEGVDRRRALLAGGAVALAPAVVLTAYINWDLLAVALLSAGLLLLARARYWSGGALAGLAVAAKFYPFLVFGPLLVLVLRRWAGRDGGLAAPDFLRALGGAAAAWAAVNLPVMLAAPEGWATFFTFSRERGADWGSVYYVLDGYGLFGTDDLDLVNATGTVALAAACALIAALGVFARRPPRPEQLVFLVVAAFLITNKVWSPQFVLWLVPLAVLAWPHTLGTWPPLVLFLLWQTAEVGYFFGIWQHLLNASWSAEGAVGAEQGLGFAGYSVLSLARACTLLALCACVAADCLRSGKTVAGLR